ncbi:MAG: PQQ-binding-like beta-propeller repeat protein [Phycisphaerales bacterium]|nr:MAG: PQQ-binding-like beta-propeller repeat protein [Phycisphaerales bacterium]
MTSIDQQKHNLLCIVLILFMSRLSLSAQTASDIIKQTGVQGGLVVHLGCGNGKLTADLRINERYLVQGLDTDPICVANTRKLLQSKGLNGPVAADLFDGEELPYVNGIVNLLVASDLGNVPMDEVRRVLAPEGVAFIRDGNEWQRTVEQRPSDIDEWTHFLHDSSNHAVANDMQVGPPKRLHWLAGPKWCRSHETPSSVSAVVTSGGRIFAILDEGPTGVFRKLPQKCMLVARDAFSGVLLWKQPMRHWQAEFGTGEGNRWNIHHTIPRRLVAKDDLVYVTLGFLDSPVSVLDAATGEIKTEAIEGTKGTDEMILSEGVLIVKITKERSVGATVRFSKETLDDALAAIDVETDKELWRQEHIRVVSYALAAKEDRLVYHNMEEIVCLDLRSGKELWRAPHVIGSTLGGISNLVVSNDLVFFYGNRRMQETAGGTGEGKNGAGNKNPSSSIFLTVFSMEGGNELWQCRSKMAWAGACTQPADLFIIDGIVYCGSFEGRDIKTGEIKKKLTTYKLISPGHHYRCHRSKATVNYLILPKRGAEFVDVRGDNHMRNDWLRAPCFTGATPANGLLYVPTDQCFCYPGVKFNGYFALSAEAADKLSPSTNAAVERGPGFDRIPGFQLLVSKDDWPMYRRDVQRSGSTETKVPLNLYKQWEIELNSNGSQPVIVGKRLWVAEKEAHHIRCLDADNGTDIWSFTTGGRINSAPTVYKGMVLFGCRDGYVYCLGADNGELAWRFRAAPDNRRLVSYEQVESVWPAHGSVLVQDGVVYFAAGRSSFLDGGIIVYGLDACTGEVLYSHILEGPWPDIKKDTGTPFAMEGSLNDLMVSDGKDLYLQRIKFDARLNRLETPQGSPLGDLDMGANHLVATGGFLDDTGYDRIYWMYGKRWPGFYFAQQSPKAGQIIVFDDNTTYAVKYFYRRYQWSTLFIPAEHGYLLFADDNNNEPTFLKKGARPGLLEWLPKETLSDNHRRGGQGVEKGTGYVRQKPEKWQSMVPIRIRAMLLTQSVSPGPRTKLLFTAGLPDVIDPEDPMASFEGRKGSLLNVYSARDGSILKSIQLASVPAFDGMIAANSKIYMVTNDGKLFCMAGKK